MGRAAKISRRGSSPHAWACCTKVPLGAAFAFHQQRHLALLLQDLHLGIDSVGIKFVWMAKECLDLLVARDGNCGTAKVWCNGLPWIGQGGS